MKELVRCRPCGFVMQADTLGDVCPACGMPRTAFEPYREKVSIQRLFILNFDLHPIAIHLSQALVIAIPMFAILLNLFPLFKPQIIQSVLSCSVFLFPFTLLLAICTGIIDGITRFKTLKTPLLRVKIIFSTVILVLSVILFFATRFDHYGYLTIIVSLLCLATAVRLGLWGKKLIYVILPGTYTFKLRKGKKTILPKQDTTAQE